MKQFLWITPVAALALSLSCCTNQGSGDDPLGTGPYDSAGNYREDWADDPSKWSKPGKRTPGSVEAPPVIAANDQPPAHSTPISSAPRQSTRTTSQPVEVAARSKPNSSSVKTTSRPTTKSSSTKSTPKKSVTKTKPKPKSTRYTVKKGDSLSTIAARNRSSVSAIQKANGIKGTLIRPGQSLVIPKR